MWRGEVGRGAHGVHGDVRSELVDFKLLVLLCSLQCAVCSDAVCSVPFAVCRLQCAVCSVQIAVCSLQCAVCSVKFVVCSLECAEKSV